MELRLIISVYLEWQALQSGNVPVIKAGRPVNANFYRYLISKQYPVPINSYKTLKSLDFYLLPYIIYSRNTLQQLYLRTSFCFATFYRYSLNLRSIPSGLPNKARR